MARIIYTTCGTSLLTSSCWKGCIPPVSENSTRNAEIDEANRKHIEGEMCDPDSLASSFLPEFWEYTSNLRRLPAELASLRVIGEYCKRVTGK